MTHQKSILITGCSAGGIGDALAQEFHRRGLRIFATARTPSKISHLKSLGIETLTLDVTSSASIADAAAKVSTATGGTLDYLLNNSGVGYTMPVTDLDLDAAKALFDVNVFAVVAVTQAFMPLLVRARGTVVNNTSIVSVAPLPFFGVYNASKAAAHSLTRNMRLEFGPLGVAVVEVVSGKVASRFFDNVRKESTLGVPEGSYYAAAGREVASMMAGRRATGEDLDAMPADVFARRVAGDVLKRRPASEVWRGGSASIVWVLTTFFSRRVQDVVLGQLTRFGVVASKLAGARVENPRG